MLFRAAVSLLSLTSAARWTAGAQQQQQEDNRREDKLLLISSSSLSLSACDATGQICFDETKYNKKDREDDDGSSLWIPKDEEWIRSVILALLEPEGAVGGCGCAQANKNPACARAGAGAEAGAFTMMMMVTTTDEEDDLLQAASERQLATGKKSSDGKKGVATPQPTPSPQPEPGCDTCCGGTTKNNVLNCRSAYTLQGYAGSGTTARLLCIKSFLRTSFDFPTPTCKLPERGCFTCCPKGSTMRPLPTCASTFSKQTITTGIVYCWKDGAKVENFGFDDACQFPSTTKIPPEIRRTLLAPGNNNFDLHGDNNKAENVTVPDMPRHSVAAAFVRVPKTGSTTLLQFLYHVFGLFSWTHHLSGESTKPQENDDKNQQAAAMMAGAAASCVFGRVATTAHLGSNYHDQEVGNQNANVGRPRGGWNSCPHIPFPNLVNQWSKSLDLWAPPEKAVFEGGDAANGGFSFGLRTFSMVRDPFDRLVSFFFYLQSFSGKNEFLKETVTEEQYDRVKAGDLFGWMELLHKQGGCGLQLPFQFHYFHQDLDTALALIEQDETSGRAPKIFVMLTECYEPSLRLLVENFNEQFEGVSVDAFVASPAYKMNKNTKSLTNKASYKKHDLDEQGLKSLRELAEVWFEDDFVFYNAAVKQFQKHVAKSKLDPSHFESCAFWDSGN